MVNFRSLFQQFTVTSAVPDQKLKPFSENMLRRMLNDNSDGRFDDLRDSLTDDYVAYYGPITNKNTHLALQFSYFNSLENMIKEFKISVIRKESMLHNLFGRGTPRYESFYPNGLAEYSMVDFNNAEWTMHRWLSMAKSYEFELGPSFVKWFTTLYEKFVAMGKRQVYYHELKEQQQSESPRSRSRLEKTVLKTILYLPWELLKMPRQLLDLFDASVLRLTKDTSHDEQGNILATVKDASTDLPVEGVTMQVLDASINRGMSNELGRVRSETLPVDRYDVKFVKADYEPLVKTIDVIDEDDSKVEIKMDRS